MGGSMIRRGIGFSIRDDGGGVLLLRLGVVELEE